MKQGREEVQNGKKARAIRYANMRKEKQGTRKQRRMKARYS